MPETHTPTRHNWRRKERKTALAVAISAVTMALEITCGLLSHSMALTADGIHMAGHVLVIGLSWGAYVFVDRLERKGATAIDGDRVLALTAFSSALLLLVMAIFILVEGVERFMHPVESIDYVQGMVVAGIALVVNLACAGVLHEGSHGQGHDLNSHAAYLHVLADAVTSVGTIAGLLCAMWLGITWIDALVACLAAVVIMRWAAGLLSRTARQLTRK